MSRSSTPEEQKALLRMVCGRPTNWEGDIPRKDWLILKLPDGQFGAFWQQGLEIEHCSAVVSGDYSACAFIGPTKQSVLEYIRESDEKGDML
ncbi:hypothetical protein ACT4YP_20890 (plasmid) [Acinetobacter baumannii]|uniref:hypothetical protein n=1 Tax=Klebsiella pneumoniae TaxID=573 RepID=UPI001FAD4F74|nr:hypothetical protein [Klebsiella pneumoniae]MCI7974602.1 hypothetical protein [Klebsiella pneumoniae]MCI7989829.1 hypothetical protein [Klebsiella pneumoniae]